MARRDSFEVRHSENLIKYRKELEVLFNDMCKRAGMAAEAARPFVKNVLDGAELMRIPAFKSQLDKIIRRFAKLLKSQISRQCEQEWKLANDRYDKIVQAMAGNIMDTISEERRKGLLNHNVDAMNAFLERKVRGLGLSERVWKYSQQFRDQIELGLQLGIAEGQSAAEMARELKSYLRYPDKLFRRVRDKETGELKLSHPASLFHPGAGVYRSSYQNALRLAVTETNMAYRKADSVRRKQLDFVVGIEIHLSNNHNCKGVPEGEFYDICDILRGRYPADFDFVGWHPNCRCWTSNILQTEEEFIRDMDGVYRGSVNEVKDVPPQFKDWVRQNRDRIGTATRKGSLPYFIRDNAGYVSRILGDTSRVDALMAQYGAIKPKEVGDPLKGMVASDITGGIVTKVWRGINSLIKGYYEAETRREQVVILKTIVADKAFNRLDYHSTAENSIFGIGMEGFDKKLSEGEMPTNLRLANKLLKNGFDVFMLTNPNDITSADFILRKNGKLYMAEGKESYGENSLDSTFKKIKEQASIGIVDILGTTDIRYIAGEIKYAFNHYKNLERCLIFKGSKLLQINRALTQHRKFEEQFMRLWRK